MRTRTMLVGALTGVLLATPFVGSALASSPNVIGSSPAAALASGDPSGPPSTPPSTPPTTPASTPTTAPANPGGGKPGCGAGKIAASSTGGVLTVPAAGQSATDTVTIRNTLGLSFSDVAYLFAIAPNPTRSTPHTAPVVAASLSGGSYVNLPLSWHNDGWTAQGKTFALAGHASKTLKLRVTFKTGAWPGRYVSLIQTGLASCDDPSVTVSGNGFAFTAGATPPPTPTATTSTTATPSAPASAGAPSEIAGIGGIATPSGGSSVAAQNVDASSNPPQSHGSNFLLVGFGLVVAFAVAGLVTMVLLRRRRREDDDDGAAPISGAYGGGPLPHRQTGYRDVGGYGGGAPADATALVYGDLAPERSPGYAAPYGDPYAATTYTYPPEDRGARRAGYSGPPEVRPPAYGGASGYGAPAYEPAAYEPGQSYEPGPGYGAPQGYGAGQGYAGDAGGYDAPAPTRGYDANGYDANGYDRFGYPAGGVVDNGYAAGANGYAPGNGSGYDPGHGFGAQDPRWGEVAEPPAPAQRAPYEESMTERAGRHGATGDPADEPGAIDGWQGDGYGGYPDESWGYQPR